MGCNTDSLLAKAENYVTKHHLRNAQVWCVYDKDDFPDDNFNKVEQKIRERNKANQNNVTYHAAWSNQCIEYWFILHFAFYDANNDRQCYMEFLKDKFKSLGLKKYAKNDEKIFSILQQHGNPKQAIKWANKQLGSFSDVTPAKAAPATKVYLLVMELAKYFPCGIRERYI